MSGESSIQWTDATWNPTRGCSVVSPGCVNCYAMKQAHRYSGPGLPFEGYTKQTPGGPQWTGKVSLVEKALDWPLRWRGAKKAREEGRPSRIFVNSMSDLFHESLSDEAIDQVFAVMAMSPRHVFQILTKRAVRMLNYIARIGAELPRRGAIHVAADSMAPGHPTLTAWPLPNVWLGVSAENQEMADARIPLLLQTPAAVRFVSAEPLLGPIKLPPGSRTLHMSMSVSGALQNKSFKGMTDSAGRPLTSREAEATLKVLESKGVRVIPMDPNCQGFSDQTGCPGHRNAGIDWVIVGGESGPKARPCDVAWIRDIKDQCVAAGVACFVKQYGSNARDCRGCPDCGRNEGCGGHLKLNDRKGGDPSEWSADLRVRQMPGGAA